MGDRTAIAWVADPVTGEAGTTWNPVTGCDQVSAGCDNCYALTLSARLKAMGAKRYQNDGDPRTSGPGFGLTLHPELVETPKSWRKPRMVFVNSMSDLFHAKVPLSFIRDVFATIEATPQHTYQILTKRDLRVARMADQLQWPANLWMGVSVEDAAAMRRIDRLRDVPAAVRFISAEPLLGPLDGIDLSGIGWVIVGGESGPRHRPVDVEWVRGIRDACLDADVPYFFKQWGGAKPKANGNMLDGAIWEQFPERAAA